MTMRDQAKDPALLRIHLAGGLACLVIAGGAVWFGADSIAKRRGVFLNARHELTAVRSELDEAVGARTRLASRVEDLGDATRDALSLSPVRRLNKRTEELSRLAESVGVDVDRLQPGEMITDARVPVQPIDLDGSAVASDVSRFLSRLDRDLPDMHIQSIDMTSESLGSTRVRLRMTLNWFVDPADGS